VLVLQRYPSTGHRGTPLDGVNVTRAFRRLQKGVGISPVRRFHDLRHTAATLLMAGNVHPRIVSELLGHTDTRTTLDLYSHVSTEMRPKRRSDSAKLSKRQRLAARRDDWLSDWLSNPRRERNGKHDLAVFCGKTGAGARA
jgi:integrase